MNQASFFNAQFFDDDGTPLAGGLLHTYASGTTTPQATYEDQAGEAVNTNPIELDAAGRCDLWLEPDVEYTFRLERADATLVKTWDDVVGVAAAGSAVTSVNELTGAVVLTADDVGFTTGTSTTWFAGTDVSAALDDIITKVNDLAGGSTTAADVAIVDAGSYFAATNVEAALQELAADGLPSQTGNAGKHLTTDGSSLSWAAATLAAFTASIAGGNISTVVGAGSQSYGSRTCSVTGGTAPYSYSWVIQHYPVGFGIIATNAAPTSATVTFSGNGSGVAYTAWATCFVTDATGRMTSASIGLDVEHGT